MGLLGERREREREQKWNRRTGNVCDEGETLNLYLTHAVAGTHTLTGSTMLLYSFTLKVSVTHTHTQHKGHKDNKSTHIHACIHSCAHTCTLTLLWAITQSGSAHKFLSVEAACLVKVRALFLSVCLPFDRSLLPPSTSVHNAASSSSCSFFFFHLHTLTPHFCFSFILLSATFFLATHWFIFLPLYVVFHLQLYFF